ncbi:MAG: hypothetical protein M1812_001157 [Candelaria pacifica]|nr:MAG: hypothetical protein M1812_001157 [Candelaria pacifica]
MADRPSIAIRYINTVLRLNSISPCSYQTISNVHINKATPACPSRTSSVPSHVFRRQADGSGRVPELPRISLHDIQSPVNFIKEALRTPNKSVGDRVPKKWPSPRSRSRSTARGINFPERLMRSSAFLTAKPASGCSVEDNVSINNLPARKETTVQLLEESKPSPGDCKPAADIQKAPASQVPTTEDLSRLLNASASTGLDSIIRTVVNFACQTRESGERLMEVSTDLVRALRRSQDHDHVQSTIFFDLIASQLRSTVPKLNGDLVLAGMKCAIMSRSLPSLRRYMLEYRDNGYTMNRLEFSNVLFKFRSLAFSLPRDTTNADWLMNSQDLLAGSEIAGVKAFSSDEEVSLRSFLPAGACDCFIVYITTLGYFKATEALSQEWVTWQKLQMSYPIPQRQNIIQAFIESCLKANDPVRAWKIVKDSKITFDVLEKETWAQLISHPETICVLPKGIDQLLLKSYFKHLSKIERALQVKWVGGEDGYHVYQSTLENEEKLAMTMAYQEE